MKSSQILQKVTNLDPDLNTQLIVSLNGIDYDIIEIEKRLGGIYDGNLVISLEALPVDPVHAVRNDSECI